jgi:primase-polymerase (primpol)-like protein
VSQGDDAVISAIPIPRPPRPKPLTVKPDNIPARLRHLKQWVGWDYELDNARWTKVPKALAGHRASSTNPRHWSSFDDVLARYQSGCGAGIGFITTRDDGYTLIDCDHVIDLTSGAVAPWAWELVQAAHRERGTYVEVSVSRSGLHIFVRGKRVFDGIKKPVGTDQALEIYTHSRFFTMSGWRIPQ